MKKKVNIVVENTLYSLLIYWLVESPKNTLHVLEENMFPNKFIKLIKTKNVEIYLYGNNYGQYKRKKRNLIDRGLFYILERLRLRRKLKNIKINKIYGHDNTFAFEEFKKRDYIQIEDGIIDYNNSFENINNSFKEKFINFLKNKKNYDLYGRSVNCKKIILTGKAPIPKEISHKVEIINMQELWDAKTKEEQNEILDLFGFTEEIIHAVKQKKNILLTQPISEDGMVTEKEKIEIYKNIILKYDPSQMIIKTHPREKTDYKKHFPNITVLDTPFPFELISLLRVKFDKAITLFSTVALNLGEDVEVEWLGARVHPVLEEKYGDSLDLEKFKK